MNVVDSSGWLEYFANGPNTAFFAPIIKQEEELIVPTITLFEVYRRMHILRGEEDAVDAIAHMQCNQLATLTSQIALLGADLSLKNNLPMADSIIYATAKMYDAPLWTQDSDFAGLEGVKYKAKPGVKKKQKK